MAQIRVRIKINHPVSFEAEDYRDAWEAHCEEEGLEVSPEIPEDFAIAAYTNDIETGTVDLSEVLESAGVDVTAE